MSSLGPGGSDSRTSSRINLVNRPVAAADQAAVYAPNIQPQGGSTALGEGSTQIKSGGALSLEYSSDPEIVRDAIAAVRDQSDRFSQSLTDIYAASSDAQSAQALANAVSQKSLLEETFDKLAGLAASSQSGGDTDRNKIVLYISLAALALVAILFFNRR